MADALRRLLPLATLVLILGSFAGCVSQSESDGASDGEEEGAEGSDQPSEGGEPSEEESEEPSEPGEPTPEAENTAPTATLRASALNGSAPLTVDFEILASDAEDDPLTWSLDADGDGVADATGDSVPASPSFTYEAAGNYTASLNVSDGELSDQETLVINVTAPALPGGQVEELSWAVGAFGCSSDAWETFPDGTPLSGILFDEFAVDPATIGLPYVIVYAISAPLGISIPGIDFFDASGARVDRGLDGGGAAPWQVEGTVPEAAAYAIVYECGGNGGTATYVAG